MSSENKSSVRHQSSSFSQQQQQQQQNSFSYANTANSFSDGYHQQFQHQQQQHHAQQHTYQPSPQMLFSSSNPTPISYTPAPPAPPPPPPVQPINLTSSTHIRMRSPHGPVPHTPVSSVAPTFDTPTPVNRINRPSTSTGFSVTPDQLVKPKPEQRDMYNMN